MWLTLILIVNYCKIKTKWWHHKDTWTNQTLGRIKKKQFFDQLSASSTCAFISVNVYVYSCVHTFIIMFLYYFTFKENTRWHDASSQRRDMTAHKRMCNPDRLNHTDNSNNSYSITPHTVSSSHIFPLTDRSSPLLSPPTLPPAIKVNQLGLPSTTNTCMFSEWRLEEAHEVLAWKVLNRKLGGRKARGKKKLIGNQQTLIPPPPPLPPPLLSKNLS